MSEETRVPAQKNLPNPKLMATFSHALVPIKHDPYVIMNQAPITQLNTCQQIPHCNSFIRGDIMINNNIMLHHILANFYVRFFKWLVIENVLFSRTFPVHIIAGVFLLTGMIPSLLIWTISVKGYVESQSFDERFFFLELNQKLAFLVHLRPLEWVFITPLVIMENI